MPVHRTLIQQVPRAKPPENKENLEKPPSFSHHQKPKQGIKSARPLGQKCFGKVGGSWRPLKAWHAARVTCRQLYRSESGKLLSWLWQPGTSGSGGGWGVGGGVGVVASVGTDRGSDATMPAGYEESSALAYFGGARVTNKWHHWSCCTRTPSCTPLSTCDDRRFQIVFLFNFIHFICVKMSRRLPSGDH